ncbi:MAG: rane protein [Paenibacillus sp.]|nr:rane protein [Paenibacillus sp.]
MEWIWGLAGSLIIAGAAYWKGSLSLSGLAAAMLLGTSMFALGNLAWFGTLIAFFISSTLLSKLKHQRKSAAESGYAKGGRRDAGQVAANGGLGLLLCIGNAVWPDPAWWIVFVGVMATVNADTWATEIGGMSVSTPRSIINGKCVPAGTSGGVTGLGLLASLLGGAFIGLVSGWFSQMIELEYELGAIAVLFILGAVSGLIGSLADSWLGATFQVMYRCNVCGKTIEKQFHCGQKAALFRGMRWMRHDMVNAVSSIVGGIMCLAIYLLF